MSIFADTIEKAITVRSYEQTRGGKVVHVSGYDRAEIVKLISSLKAGHSITFDDGQKVSLAADGKHLNVVSGDQPAAQRPNSTMNFHKHGEHVSDYGAGEVADHVMHESARSQHPKSLGGTEKTTAQAGKDKEILESDRPRPKSMSDEALMREGQALERKHGRDSVYGVVHGRYWKVLRELKRRGIISGGQRDMERKTSRGFMRT